MSLGHAWFCIEADSMVLLDFFSLQNNLGECCFISLSFLFFAAAQRNRILKSTDIE